MRRIVDITTNIPLEAWEELPGLQAWARESINALEQGCPFQRNWNFVLPAMVPVPPTGKGCANPSPYAKLITVSLDFPRRDTAHFSVLAPTLAEINDWLSSFPANFPNYSTLGELLYGGNRNSSAQNNSYPPIGTGSGSGGAIPRYPLPYAGAIPTRGAGKGAAASLAAAGGLLHSIQKYNLPQSFPITESGRASLLEALFGALPHAFKLEEAAEAHRAIHNKMLEAMGKATENTWGNPPADSQLHIQQGEIIARRIWFLCDDLSLFSIHREASWAPGQIMSGDTDVAGVFAFKDEPLAIPLLYCYIRDADQIFKQQPMLTLHKNHWARVSAICMGTVKLWGSVVEHQYGYRAEFARIHSLDECSNPAILSALQQKYLPPQSAGKPSGASKLGDQDQ